MIHLIRSKHLMWDNRTEQVYLTTRDGQMLLPSLGRIDAMPYGLSIDMMVQWTQIAVRVEQEVINAKE